MDPHQRTAASWGKTRCRLRRGKLVVRAWLWTKRSTIGKKVPAMALAGLFECPGGRSRQARSSRCRVGGLGGSARLQGRTGVPDGDDQQSLCCDRVELTWPESAADQAAWLCGEASFSRAAIARSRAPQPSPSHVSHPPPKSVTTYRLSHLFPRPCLSHLFLGFAQLVTRLYFGAHIGRSSVPALAAAAASPSRRNLI